LLYIRLNQTLKTLSISGPSTFAAKDEIKRIGPARFDGASKSWTVSSFSGGIPEVQTLLGHYPLTIEELVLAETEEEQPQSPTAVPKGLSVPELINSAKIALEERFPKGTLVYGVISGLKASGDHAFMHLADPKDRTVSVSCAMWGSPGLTGMQKLERDLLPHGVKLEVELEVMFQVEVSLNRKNGNLSLTVQRLIPEYSLSKLLGEREKTNKKLKEEGLFEKNKRTELPLLPMRFGVLTSAAGTVIHDFTGALAAGGFGFELFWYQVSVQGQEAKRSILKGLKYFSDREDLDAILLFRGGGSVSDLAVFNDYEISKAICSSRLPVLCAIGHQEDQCSAQDVSFKSFGVPRDIGSFLADRVLTLKEQISRTSERVVEVSSQTLDQYSLALTTSTRMLRERVFRLVDISSVRVETLLTKVSVQSEKFLERGDDLVRNVFSRLLYSAQTIISRSEERVSRQVALKDRGLQLFQAKENDFVRLAAHVAEASPENQLRRGFSIIRKRGSESGQVVKNVADTEVGTPLSIELQDGSLNAVVVRE